MTMTNALIARFSGEPVLACASKAEAFSAHLQAATRHPDYIKLTSSGAERMDDNSDGFWPAAGSWLAQMRPYSVKAGILTIPVEGALIKGFPYTFYGLLTGYEYVQRAFDRGMDDPEVKGIVLKIDSPGGEVAGNFDLVDRMFARRDEKPVAAIASEHAYSAAYSIASVATEIYVARTGGVGSIGVVTSHVDVSRMMEKEGYKVTFIYAGDHKVDGNPYEALAPEVKARIQARVDYLYNVFVSTVARNRGVSEQSVRDTQALTYSAEEAVEKGLADKVASFDAAVDDFATSLDQQPQGVQMSTTQAPAASTFAQADLDAARAEGMAAGATAERERIKAIQTSAEAADRSALASHLAFNTDMSPEAANSVLAVSAKEVKQTESAATPFENAMASGNPELGASAKGKDTTTEMSASASILADFKAAGGQTATK